MLTTNRADTDKLLNLAIIISHEMVSLQQNVHHSESKGDGVKTPLSKLKTLAYLFVLVVLFGLLPSCTDNGSDLEAVQGSTKMQELAGTSWSLSLLRGDGLLLISIITADFDQDGKVEGISGCNGYSANYETDGEKISISELESTGSTCRQRLMDQETSYLETLESIETYGVRGTTMEMLDNEGRAMLVYHTLAQTKLRGSSWTLTDYDDGSGAVVPVLPGTKTTANFGDDGLLSGSGGCNGYSASYDVANKLVNIEALVMTEMACLEPEGLMEQELQYLAALAETKSYVIVGDAMGLLDGDGAILTIFSSGKE
jgi:heat shock protein HslJ